MNDELETSQNNIEDVVDEPVIPSEDNEPVIPGEELQENPMVARLKRALQSRDIIIPSDETLQDELENAKYAINDRLCADPESEIQNRHKSIQIELCIEAISKYGAEGETSHVENGISRNYDNASPYSNSTLNRIIPIVGAF